MSRPEPRHPGRIPKSGPANRHRVMWVDRWPYPHEHINYTWRKAQQDRFMERIGVFAAKVLLLGVVCLAVIEALMMVVV